MTYRNNGSLDFKKEDAKFLRDEALLKEIQDRSTNPHLKLEFPDPDVHEELFHIVKFWFGEISMPEKKCGIWTNFLEPFLKVSLEDAEDSESDIKDNSENEDESNTSVHSIIPSSPSNVAAGVLMGSSEVSKCPMVTEKPLTKLVPPESHDERGKNSHIFYGNNSFYLFFRLHHILYERIEAVKIVSSAADKRLNIVDTRTPTKRFTRFKDAFFDLARGKTDNAKFVDDCCALLGAQDTFVLFSLDNLIRRIVKRLELIGENEMDNKLRQLYYSKISKGGKFNDRRYHKKAASLLRDKNLYRIECSFEPTTCVSIQLVQKEVSRPTQNEFRGI